MEINQLRYFVAVAQRENFSRAAEQCHVAQPSLSQQIAKLERHLGQKLFHRLNRRVVLTDAGHLLLEKATAILAVIDETERELRDASDTHRSRLSLGVIPTIAPYFLPYVLQEFLPQYPNIELSVHEDVTTHLLEALGKGEIDLALVALPINDERFWSETLFCEPLLLALPANHALSKRSSIRFEEVMDERFIVLDEMHCLGEQVLSFCRTHDCAPKVSCRSAQISTVQALIATGQGISLLPAMAKGAENKSDDGVIYRALKNSSPTRTLGVLWHRHRHLNLTEQQFLAQIRTSASNWVSTD